jgi:hypothetical protein
VEWPSEKWENGTDGGPARLPVDRNARHIGIDFVRSHWNLKPGCHRFGTGALVL